MTLEHHPLCYSGWPQHKTSFVVSSGFGLVRLLALRQADGNGPVDPSKEIRICFLHETHI